MRIRPETPADIPAIRAVNDEAFGQKAEGKLVDDLRAAGLVLASLVAEHEGAVIGHLLLSRIYVGGRPAGALAPMAVVVKWQNCGIGSRLVEAGVAAAEGLGEGAIVVLGHAWFYPRFGFRPAGEFGVEAPWRVEPGAFMVRPLGKFDPAMKGRVAYPKAFEGV